MELNLVINTINNTLSYSKNSHMKKKNLMSLVVITLTALYFAYIGFMDPGLSPEDSKPAIKKESALPQNGGTLPFPLILPQTAGSRMSRSFSFPAEGIPVLMYHSISTVPGNSLCVPEKKFANQMAWLKKQNYHTLTMEEFYLAISGRAAVPRKPVLITFDDGYTDNYKTAWPILKQNGLRATFFIITGSVNSGSITWDQLKELAKQGNSIESHTVNHPNLPTLTYIQQENELAKSKQMLEERLGVNVIAACYPAGAYNETTLKLLPKIGYKLGFSTLPGKAKPEDNIYRVRRMRISAEMSGKRFRQLFP
jgi:peptidoglycan/xylan/chitin deacetylase (PgdA/CDA1 family)